MNTTATHVVEGTDLPTYDHGFGSQSYLHLGHGNKITVPDQHVAYLRHLATAATNLADLIDKAHEPKPVPELQHPGTWLPGDRTKGFFSWIRTEDRWRGPTDADDLAMNQWHRDGQVTITHLAPRTNGAS